MQTLKLIKPNFVSPLDPDYRPAVLANREFRKAVEAQGVRLVLGLERSGGELSRYETKVFPEGHPQAELNLMYIERIVKFLLWQRGGWKLYVGGPKSIGDYIKKVYAPDGERKFDYHFMGEEVYQQSFTVIPCEAAQVPPAKEAAKALGRHLDGCRIVFDLGAS